MYTSHDVECDNLRSHWQDLCHYFSGASEPNVRLLNRMFGLCFGVFGFSPISAHSHTHAGCWSRQDVPHYFVGPVPVPCSGHGSDRGKQLLVTSVLLGSDLGQQIWMTNRQQSQPKLSMYPTTADKQLVRNNDCNRGYDFIWPHQSR